MKTLTPTNLIAVEVPKEANDFKLFFEFGHTRISYNEKSESEIPIMNYISKISLFDILSILSSGFLILILIFPSCLVSSNNCNLIL